LTESAQTAKQYLHAVRQHLDVPQADQERFMERLTKAVSAYLEENEGIYPDSLADAFGQPEVCAAQLLAEIDPAVVAATRKKKKRWQHIIAGILVILTALLACLLLHLFSRGGFVIITQGTYINPEDIPPPPETGTITAQYEYGG